MTECHLFLVCECGYACVCACVYSCSCACAHKCMDPAVNMEAWRGHKAPCSIPVRFLFLKQDFSLVLKLAEQLANFRNPPASDPPHPSSHCHTWLCTWMWDAGLHACTESTLAPEPSVQPLTYSLKGKPEPVRRVSQCVCELQGMTCKSGFFSFYHMYS